MEFGRTVLRSSNSLINVGSNWSDIFGECLQWSEVGAGGGTSKSFSRSSLDEGLWSDVRVCLFDDLTVVRVAYREQVCNSGGFCMRFITEDEYVVWVALLTVANAKLDLIKSSRLRVSPSEYTNSSTWVIGNYTLIHREGLYSPWRLAF
jgi:hypothetical protein